VEQPLSRKTPSANAAQEYSVDDILGAPAILALIVATIAIGGTLIFVAVHF
jgi:hypothetical protein